MGRGREVKAYLCTPLEVSRRRPIPIPPADCTAERPVDLGSDTVQPTGYGKREEIALSVQRDDLAKDQFTSISSHIVHGHDAWSDPGFWPEVENTGEDRATSTTSFQTIDFSSGFVDVKGTDDDEARIRGEISDRDGERV